ncbi:MAG: PIN domain-containing protein, partial [Verrucomicrobiales bacterium]
NSVVLSTQVVNEVCNNLIRKAGYTEPEIQQTIQNLAAVYPILDVTLPIIRQASVLRVAYRLSYWDSLILATAQDAGCSVVYSEDMQEGLRIGALTLRNPYKATKIPSWRSRAATGTRTLRQAGRRETLGNALARSGRYRPRPVLCPYRSPPVCHSGVR